MRQHEMQTIYDNISKTNDYIISVTNEMQQNVKQLAENRNFKTIVSSSENIIASDFRLLYSFNLDFAEVINKDAKVIRTFYRPGLLNTKLELTAPIQTGLYKTVEYDRAGQHAAFTSVYPIEEDYFLYCGKYIDSSFSSIVNKISDGTMTIYYKENDRSPPERMTPFQLYEIEDGYQTVLTNNEQASFIIAVTFDKKENIPIVSSFIKTTAVVALVSMLVAILLGMYLTGRTKREIDNLVTATTKVAEGNFDTTVMAYQEGEFSLLADSFTEMVIKLKAIQNKLSTVEKIAAWQTIGRKIAHEIKNPLSPISIAVDDLRASYFEKLPDFDKTLNETTTTIKSEVKRMTELLDEFVSFARMKQAEPDEIRFDDFIKEIQRIYVSELKEKKLRIATEYNRKNILLDRDLFKQVLINLIKNGFETSENASVSLTVKTENDNISFIIEDNGPGFTEEKLINSFEPFATTKKDGSGLGLVICHRIVHDHNGIMELSNKVNGGGRVTITLPIK